MCRYLDNVYDEIDRLAEAGEFGLAYEAVDRAIERYFDRTPTARFDCLWLFHKGASIADAAGRPHASRCTHGVFNSRLTFYD